MLFANVCAGFIWCCHEGCGERRFLGILRLLGVLCIWEVLLALPVYPSCVQDSGYEGVPVAGHALWAEVGGSIICVIVGEFTGLHRSAPYVCWEVESVPVVLCRKCWPQRKTSLHGCYACVVCWAKGGMSEKWHANCL